MKKVKPLKPKHKEAHVMNTKYGMGDFTGTAIKARVGKIRPGSFTPGSNPASKTKLKKPPKSLA